MTPEQKIKREILFEAGKDAFYKSYLTNCEVTADNVDELYYQFVENAPDCEQDLSEEFRCSGVSSNIKIHDFSRNYECESVARQLSDGSWVGWTYWYGGGKHGSPESIPWMDTAYHVSATEKTVIAYDFKKI
jgi:hypothetical protein